jgi:hypothetical protein
VIWVVGCDVVGRGVFTDTAMGRVAHLEPGAPGRRRKYDAALKVCGQWTSAEPEPPGETLEEYEAN